MGLKLIWDIESKNLLNADSIDYTASPYCIRDPRFIHCVGFKEYKTDRRWLFELEDVYNGKLEKFLLEEDIEELIGHNIINFDLKALAICLGIDYAIGCSTLGIPDMVGGRPIKITDTLVMSKTLNPDRPRHGIEYFGSILGLEKIDWRAKAIEIGLIQSTDPKGSEFRVYHPEMGIYMVRDIDVNERVYDFLIKEWGDWAWDDAYELEKAVAEIITRQEHRGFWFNRERAVELVKDLDEKMEAIRILVEPLIPDKPLTKTALADYTPVAKQFKKNGEPTTHILNFAKKHGGEFVEVDGVWTAELYGKKHTLPMAAEPIFTHTPAKLEDTTHVKQWLVELGWKPSAYKERDLTVDSKKKKISREKFEAAVEKWLDQTFESAFFQDRIDELCEGYLGIRKWESKELILHKMKQHEFMKRPLKVYTNPTITVGQEKEIDPKLLELKDKFQYAKEISDYLTYRHRRNSILGGGVDPDDDEDMQKGWMSVDRINQDHRIPTPADTCGAGTSRFKHRLVANIPRVTSLYGDNMRSLFGADVEAGFYQLGYDFASLEAMIESHYCWKYDYTETKEYCMSLTMTKPNDVHTKTAAKISEVIGQIFNRTPAKSVKYACAYGAAPARVAKTVGCTVELGQKIHAAYWEAALPLKGLAEKLKIYWETTGGKKFILGIDGRKIPTRSASALINSLFQSAGVICAKRAMVIHDRKLREAGQFIDFFKDDWKNSAFVQQLIAYHDEANLEVHKSLIKWKTFPVVGAWEVMGEKGKMVASPEAEAAEKAAKAFKKENPTWSEVGHTDKGYYLGYCEAGKLATEAVRESGEYYNLNVTLSADYMLGRNWAETH